MPSRLDNGDNYDNNDDGDGYADNDTHLNMTNEHKTEGGGSKRTFMSFHLSHIEFVMNRNQMNRGPTHHMFYEEK